MGVITESQVDKRCYRNQTAGWLGVVKLDHLGQQIGESVEPHGTVWLTDDEATLTARAPKNPQDNPFVEKDYVFVDEKGEQVTQAIRRLVLITDDGELPDPNERYVPGLSQHPPQHVTHGPSAEAGQTDTATALEGDSDRPVATTEGEDPMPGKPDLHPSVSPEVQAGWSDPPANWSSDPQPGSLAGGDAVEEAAATPVQDADSDGSSDEETAAETSTGEETGAAAIPEGEAPEGEFAQHEEVGTPDTPQAAEGTVGP